MIFREIFIVLFIILYLLLVVSSEREENSLPALRTMCQLSLYLSEMDR